MRTYKKLTQKDIDSAKPESREYVLADAQLPGFGLRVRPSGARTYVFVYRNAGQKQRRYTIGKPSVFTLEQARKKAKDAAYAASNGSDPAATKIEARRTTVEAIYVQYDELRISQFSKGHSVRVRGIFKNEVIPRIGSKPIGVVTRSDVRSVTDKKVADGKRNMANNIHRAISAFLAWCVDREIIDTSPLNGADLPHRHKSRERCLTPRELITILHACDQLADARWQAAILLLMLTGQRKSEVLGARLSEFNLPMQRWNIPAERSKNRYPQTVHLCPAAIEAIEKIPKVEGQEYLFQSYVTKTAKPIAETNASIRKLKTLVCIHDWRLHDLRRSVATHMAGLKVAPHVIQVVLNHRSGVRSGVTAIYNRYTYGAEARDAWNLWGAQLKEWAADKKFLSITAEEEEGVVI
jgi:integrase